LILIASIYGVWRARELVPVLTATLREATMLMFTIGMSLLYFYAMSYLHISESTRNGSYRWNCRAGCRSPPSC
jgi:C4-dicarboxylate transporter DctM subunit